MKLTIKIVLSVGIIFSIIHGQDFLFDKYLPKTLIQNPSHYTNVKSSLKVKASIHPDLIYYEIKRFNLVYSNIPQKDSLINEIITIENHYLFERSKWFNEQKIIVKEMDLPLEIKWFCNKQFMSKIQTSLKDTISPNVKINDRIKNEIDYFAWIYYNKIDSTQYDSSIDYGALRCNKESRYLDQINTYYNNLFPDIKCSLSDVNQYDPYLYLMKDSKFPLIDLYVRFYKSAYSIKRHRSFSLSVCLPQTQSLDFNAAIPIIDYTDSYKMLKKINTSFYGIQISYDKVTRQLISPFSYISFSIGFRRNNKEIKTSYDADLNKSVSSAYIDYNYKITFSQNDLSIDRINCVNLNILTPIMAITRNLILEAGIQSTLFYTKYSHDYSYSFRAKEGYWAGSLWNPYYYSHTVAQSSDEVNTSDNSYTKFYLYPLISVNFDILTRLRCNFIFDFKSFSTNIGFNVF